MFQVDCYFSPQYLQKKYAVNTADFQQYATCARTLPIATLPKQKVQVTVVLSNDRKLQMLNRKYRQKNYPTDVLSFFLFDSDVFPSSEIFGEIYISLETASRQAAEQSHSLQQELSTLFVHGLLHLLGYDHENDADFLRMNRLEKEILKMPKK